MTALLMHREQLAAVRDEPSLVSRAIDEAARWAPPLGFLGRRARIDTEVEGVGVRAGDLVCAVVLAANRDPAVFPDPDVFDITRANSRRALSFSHGPHFCLGFNLAKLEVELAVMMLLQELPELTLAEAPVMRGFAFRRPERVVLKWSPTATR